MGSLPLDNASSIEALPKPLQDPSPDLQWIPGTGTARNPRRVLLQELNFRLGGETLSFHHRTLDPDRVRLAPMARRGVWHGMISYPLRCIYIHIPKTGGNSVNRALGVEWQDHKDLAMYACELTPGAFASFYKFAIVRNPWSRIFSDYNYQRKKSRPKASKLFVYTDAGEKRRFGDWVGTALADPFHYDPPSWGGEVSEGLHRWSPQVDWISVNGRIAVDAVVHLERLTADFRQVWRTLGVAPRALPHRNRRLHWHYSWYYDDATRDLVAAYYARDIETFGYRFEPNPVARARHALHACADTLGALAYG